LLSVLSRSQQTETADATRNGLHRPPQSISKSGSIGRSAASGQSRADQLFFFGREIDQGLIMHARVEKVNSRWELVEWASRLAHRHEVVATDGESCSAVLPDVYTAVKESGKHSKLCVATVGRAFSHVVAVGTTLCSSRRQAWEESLAVRQRVHVINCSLAQADAGEGMPALWRAQDGE
jgi:reverse gyrase